MGGGRHSRSRAQANIHLSPAPAHQRIGLTVADFQRTARTQPTSRIAPHVTEHLKVFGESSVSFPTWAGVGLPAKERSPLQFDRAGPRSPGDGTER